MSSRNRRGYHRIFPPAWSLISLLALIALLAGCARIDKAVSTYAGSRSSLAIVSVAVYSGIALARRRRIESTIMMSRLMGL